MDINCLCVKRKYEHLRDLDIRFRGLQKDMERQCDDAVKAEKRGHKGGGGGDVHSDLLIFDVSNEMALAHKECMLLAKARLSVAVQTCEFVDSCIQQLDIEFTQRVKRCNIRETGSLQVDDKSHGEVVHEVGYTSETVERRQQMEVDGLIDDLRSAREIVSHESLEALHGSCKAEHFEMDNWSVAKGNLALAMQKYEFFDGWIQRLDIAFRRYVEECKQAGSGCSSLDDDSCGEVGHGVGEMEVDGRVNKEIYCYCHQVSSGDMLSCYSPKCSVKRYHVECLGITKKPRGKWSCPECSIGLCS